MTSRLLIHGTEVCSPNTALNTDAASRKALPPAGPSLVSVLLHRFPRSRFGSELRLFLRVSGSLGSPSARTCCSFLTHPHADAVADVWRVSVFVAEEQEKPPSCPPAHAIRKQRMGNSTNAVHPL